MCQLDTWARVGDRWQRLWKALPSGCSGVREGWVSVTSITCLQTVFCISSPGLNGKMSGVLPLGPCEATLPRQKHEQCLVRRAVTSGSSPLTLGGPDPCLQLALHAQLIIPQNLSWHTSNVLKRSEDGLMTALCLHLGSPFGIWHFEFFQSVWKQREDTVSFYL